jgi:hypothetical protein
MKTEHIFGLIIALAIVCLSAPAQTKNERCAIRGWVRDAEPRKDIYIYNGPGQINPFTPYDIIGHLDNSTEPGEEKIVEMIGFKLHPRAGKWIEIRRAADLSEKVLFTGNGWIPAERVVVSARSLDGKAVSFYSKPRPTSKKVGAIPDGTSLSVSGFACFGLKVRYRGKAGWLPAANICHKPDSSCGLSGNAENKRRDSR